MKGAQADMGLHGRRGRVCSELEENCPFRPFLWDPASGAAGGPLPLHTPAPCTLTPERNELLSKLLKTTYRQSQLGLGAGGRSVVTTIWAGISLERGARPQNVVFGVFVAPAPAGSVSVSDEYVSRAQALCIASGTGGCGGFKSDVCVPE